MKVAQYKEIEEHVPAIEKYLKEVKVIEAFFKEKELSVENTTPMFWNHIITLLERIDENAQNEIEISDAEEMSSHAQELTNEFENILNDKRKFDLTEFENYMMTIHFEQIIKEK